MLCFLCDSFQESCCQYWPAAVGQVTQFEEFTVDFINEDLQQGYTIRTLSLLNKKVFYGLAYYFLFDANTQ